MPDNIVHALAGAGGGIISMLLTYPLVSISSRLQVEKDTTSPDSYKDGVDAFEKIAKNEGVAGFYSGLNSALFGIALTNGIYYFFYEWTKSGFEKTTKGSTLTTGQSMIAGALAGAATCITTNPIWVVNTRLITKKTFTNEEGETHRMGAIDTLAHIVKEDGIFSLWQGLIPALYLVINPVIQYTIFEQAKNWLMMHNGVLGNLDFFLLGAFSKLIATSLTYPYIVIKSRMQLKQSSDENQRYRSVLDGFRKVLKHEGVAGLYKGLCYKLVQSVLTAAFLFMAKESLFRFTLRILQLIKIKRN
ncbi:putative peroxisomal membrane protein Pmp47 [Basidiobolus meristosporus CBS 931.73]|uniref:Putative peroxisomal membrane protein Pmp47 n=1 Tax=Basidiobolus meristosporus CBS 931.73 TaxID=1314790 RepID=A0A1Y1YX53_9FUNG|nr:putative peroxisomal membrane protein Pmp47 [Basidiobolus meristosporus CBS 931.73]|eukprot:ORY02638.1 putative peroxisomal membrane protein Pmp47 [Basidiobolus meristosporus CBS 931.73]